jgi:hypothetical protein
LNFFIPHYESNEVNTVIWLCNPQIATGLTGWTNLSSTIESIDQITALGILIANFTDVLYYSIKSGCCEKD